MYTTVFELPKVHGLPEVVVQGEMWRGHREYDHAAVTLLEPLLCRRSMMANKETFAVDRQ